MIICTFGNLFYVKLHHWVFSQNMVPKTQRLIQGEIITYVLAFIEKV